MKNVQVYHLKLQPKHCYLLFCFVLLSVVIVLPWFEYILKTEYVHAYCMNKLEYKFTDSC